MPQNKNRQQNRRHQRIHERLHEAEIQRRPVEGETLQKHQKLQKEICFRRKPHRQIRDFHLPHLSYAGNHR